MNKLVLDCGNDTKNNNGGSAGMSAGSRKKKWMTRSNNRDQVSRKNDKL